MALTAERSPYDDSVYYVTDPVTGQTGSYDTRGLTYFEQDPYIRNAIADYHERIGFFNPETGGPWWDLDYVVGGAPTHYRDVGPWRNPAYQDPEYFREQAGKMSMDDIRRVIMALESGTINQNDPTYAVEQYLAPQPEKSSIYDFVSGSPGVSSFLERVAKRRAEAGKPIPFENFMK